MKNIKNWLYQFLRKTQKYTGTDNVYLARGGIWLTFGQINRTVTSFLLAITFANLLDPATYGYYKYLLSILGMLTIFTLTGINYAVTQAVARGLEGSFYSGFNAKLKWGALGSAIALAGAIYYQLQGNHLLPIPLLLIAVFLPLKEASRVYIEFLIGRKLFDFRTKYSIIRQIAFTAIMIAALFLTKNLFWLVAVYLIYHTFSDYFLYSITKIKFRPNKEEDPQTINYGKHLSLMGVIGQSTAYLDKILLFALMGPAQLAVYSFATLLPEEIQKILGNVSTLAFPKLAAKSREEIKTTIMKKVWKVSLFTGAIIIFYVIFAPFFYKIFFPQYLESIRYSRVFILSFISMPVIFLGTAFEAKMMKKELYLIKIAHLINIGLMAALIPLYGIWGAIMAVIGAQIFKLGLVLFLFRKF